MEGAMRTCVETGFVVLAPGVPEHDEDTCSACGACMACAGYTWCPGNSAGVHQWLFMVAEERKAVHAGNQKG